MDELHLDSKARQNLRRILGADEPAPPPSLEGMKPCRFCGQHCADYEWVEDWHGRGQVVRITAMCDEASQAIAEQAMIEPQKAAGTIIPIWMLIDKDDIRTDFAPESQAVAEWNDRFGVGGRLSPMEVYEG